MSILIIRHASAGARGSMGPDADMDRPLDALGLEQSQVLADQLCSRDISQLLTSPARRCQQTLEPLADKTGLEIEDHPALLEGQSALSAEMLVRDLARDGTTAALCSHGDIIPDLIQVLARQGMTIVGPRSWAKGSTWELRTKGSDIVQAEFLGPY